MSLLYGTAPPTGATRLRLLRTQPLPLLERTATETGITMETGAGMGGGVCRFWIVITGVKVKGQIKHDWMEDGGFGSDLVGPGRRVATAAGWQVTVQRREAVEVTVTQQYHTTTLHG